MRILFALLMCAFICCDEEAMLSEKDKFFRGNHPLESVEIISDSGSFRQYIPNPSKSIYVVVYSQTNKAQILFKSNTGEYINALLPYDKMRFQFLSDESTEQPYCKFRWSTDYDFNSSNWQDDMIYYVVAVKKTQIRQK